MSLTQAKKQVKALMNDTQTTPETKSALKTVKKHLDNKKQHVGVRKALTTLETIADDVDTTPYERTRIWGIVSTLEDLSESF